MSVNSRIQTALDPLVANVDPDKHEGKAAEYITYNYSEIPELHADGVPHAIRYLIQIHWVLPIKIDPISKKKQIRNAIHAAGFTYPSVINASDGDVAHYVFECEGMDGDV